MQRRDFLQLLLGAAAATLLLPINVLAAIWNKAAFEATTVDAAAKDMGIASESVSPDIQIKAPDYAENGAVVQVEVRSNIPNTEAIAILVDKNPTSLIANFMFSNGAEPFVVTRIKMAETSNVVAIAKVGGQYFKARKNIEVSENGCG